ncbi:uncharacterized protein LOC128724667 [Anopheles nili]|uniref:uncharacterized protein LOC128724667 n=1 Tax=Anopheles nili TaxID=185578 RepID=UPI00237AB207|nr:uncharacterized protein LOC128724667 [Anopheles nili]
MEKHAGEVNGCCRMEPFFDEAIAEKCFHDVSAKFPPGTTDFVVCYIDCEYREMGLVTAHEDVDEAKYNSYHASFDPAYREAVARAVASCASIQDDIRRDVQSIGSSCSAFSFMYHMCVTRQVMIGYCPADRWNPSEICQMCQHNCMYETLGGINGFDIDLSKLHHLTDAFPPDFQDVARMALEDCTIRLRRVMEEIKQVNSPCSPLGRMVQICLDTTIFENCPASRWTASIACNKHRSGIAYC